MNCRSAYNEQRRNAKRRGIEWRFTYVQWLEWWVATGKINQRGRKADQYVMARHGDKGPYSPGNCYCCTQAENASAPWLSEHRSQAQRESWRKPGRESHLQRREKHPRARACVAPDGTEYPSAALAAEAHGCTRHNISRMCREGRGWSYVDDERAK